MTGRRTAHWQPKDRKEDMAEDIRNWVRQTSDPKAMLPTLTKMSYLDLTVLMIAVHAATPPE